jgi:hypothetical protein
MNQKIAELDGLYFAPVFLVRLFNKSGELIEKLDSSSCTFKVE